MTSLRRDALCHERNTCHHGRGHGLAIRGNCWHAVILFLTTWISSLAPTAAEEVNLVVEERLGEEWRQERLTFPITLPEDLPIHGLCVRSHRGETLPAQFTANAPHNRAGTLSFIANLGPWMTKRWTLDRAPARLAPSDISIQEVADEVVLGTSRIAVRCPTGTRHWNGGTPVSEVPPPISAISLSSGDWMPCGALNGRAQVKSLTGEFVDRGTVSAKYRLRYEFEEHREWVIDIEVLAGQEVVLFTEKLNLTPQMDFLENLRPPGTPDGNYAMQAYGDRLYQKGTYWSISLDGLRADHIAWQPTANTWPPERTATRQWGTFPIPESAGPILTLHPSHGEWWLNASQWVGFYRDDSTPYLGILALNAGLWTCHRDNAIAVEKTKAGGLRAVLPVSAGTRRWALYASTRDAAAAMPAEEPESRERPGREHPRPPQLATIKYGLLPLDLVKGWTLAFADPPNVRYPFLFTRPKDASRIRTRIAQDRQLARPIQEAQVAWGKYAASRPPHYPFQERWLTQPANLDNLYLATRNEQYAEAMGELLTARLQYYVHQTKEGVGLTGYRHGHSYGMFHLAIDVLPRSIREADLALGAPGVPARQKAEIRSFLAFWGELFASRDYMPAGYNHGNTDMVTSWATVLGAIGCLLPGHPRAAEWRRTAIEGIEAALAAGHHLPGATQDEWYGHLSLDLCTWSAAMLKRAGDRDFFKDERLRRGLDLYGQLLVPPDPRYGHGYVVPFGNGQGHWNRSAQWAIAAEATRSDDPEFAQRMMWYWVRAGRPLMLKTDPQDVLSLLGWIDESITPRNPQFQSARLEGWGVVFREHCGSADETFLAFQAGKPAGLSQYNAEGGFQWHSFGQPLSLVFGIRTHDIAMHAGQANACRQRWMANRPSFGERAEHDEGTGTMIGWIPSAGADYAATDWRFRRLQELDLPQPPGGDDGLVLSMPRRGRAPEQALLPGAIETVDPISWRRQILFVKPTRRDSACYVVVRDDALSPVPWDWNIWCLASDQRITGEGGFFTGKFGVNLAVIPLPVTGDVVSGAYGPRQSFAGDYRQLLYQARLPASQRSYTALLYPWQHGTRPPVVTPDATGSSVRLVVPGETHTITTRPNGVALTRSAEDRLTLSLFAAADVAEEAGHLLASKSARHMSGFLEICFLTDSLRGECDGPDREVTVKWPEKSPMSLTLDGRPVQPIESQAGMLRFSVPAGRHRFQAETIPDE